MDFARFVEENRPSWRELEVLLDRVEGRGLAELGAEGVRDLARLYRKASADLLLARELGRRADVSDYLEALVGRAYGSIYRPGRIRWRWLVRYAAEGWPRALRRERRYVAWAVAAFLLGFGVAFVGTVFDPDAFYALIPGDMAAFYGERHEDYRAARFGEFRAGQAASFSASLMTNNIRVALFAFALGVTFGVGTLMVLFWNGVLLGAIAANFLIWDQSLELWALILPHGVTEFAAIFLGGGAGLVLADAMLRPGRRSRMQSLRSRAGDALLLVGAAVPLLVFSGVVEAWFTPLSVVPDVAKLLFAAAAAGGLTVWVAAPWVDWHAPGD